MGKTVSPPCTLSYSGTAFIGNDFGAQTTATGEFPDKFGIRLFNGDGAGGQNDTGNLFRVYKCNNNTSNDLYR